MFEKKIDYNLKDIKKNIIQLEKKKIYKFN